MKKLLCLCLAALLLFGCQLVQPDLTENTTDPAELSTAPSTEVTQPSAQATPPSTEPTEPKFLGSESYRIAPNHIFPFVYTDEVGFEWYEENVIGPNDCEIGHLYIKNKRDGSITEVYTEPLYSYLCTKDHIYYIPEAEPGTIYRYGYEDQTHTVVYQVPEGEKLICFSYWGLDPNGWLYILLNNSYVVEYCISNSSSQIVMEQYRAEWAQIYYDKSKNEPYLEWTGDLSEGAEEKTYWYYFRTGEQVEQPEQAF